MSDFYVYIYYRLDGHTPCYVGKGRGRRWQRHEGNCKNPHLQNILRAAGGRLPRMKFKEGLSEREAFAIEKELIASIGREPHGPLVNMTDGGEGPSGYVFTSEDCARVSAGLKGRSKTEAHRLAVGAALRSSPKAVAQRAALYLSRRGKPRKPESIEAMRRSLTGKKRGAYSAAHCAAISEGKFKEWALRRAFTELIGAS